MRLATDPTAENVHGFRTSSRRIEVLTERLLPDSDRNQRKLLKLLSRIRRRAGRLRDIDVQLAALRSFKILSEPRRKRQLVEHLLEVRQKHERRLAKQLEKATIAELRKRMRLAARRMNFSKCNEPLTVARQILASISLKEPVTEKMLHDYRVAVKQARYAAEFAAKSAEVSQFIAELKVLQDALGDWHDWMTLTNTASERLGEIGQSSLVAALHNATRLRFRRALATVSASRERSDASVSFRQPALRASSIPTAA